MRAWGSAVAAVHLALGLSGWLLIGVPPWFFGGCALLTLGVTLLAAPLMRPRPSGGDDGGGGRDPGPDDPDPPWWPEFERAFREHVEAGRRTPV